uniref:RNA polymerase alpha subunit n=1 Tax=Annona cherimola TaxID=49314 RepID=A0A161H3S3_ANNCH|nr:RNA polymerase alpha subunit [Annona cherimola]YP_009252561.1 RNA polymerase alpha subunit [Annona cherimola]YP_010623824.1 RNA polymerase alpha subunit [Annona squamosa]YP_010623875.1 RNA polymerase alpha subunit [Annona squamosa]YP_010623940.1 RNA polymerase alpha subunit [Annona x atemoya]YP_010623991.1 RNA polymerase alpha subunit [Annona x atemoya]WBF97993.1 RNA polymerase alpha subunit [Annona reticulata]ANA56599.1 RNA polymerase alpha subunit [Annona cherimola]ANA56650.1 RNA polym
MDHILWHCTEARARGGGDSSSYSYGRFVLSPLWRGQSETIGFVLRRILTGEIESTRITHAKFIKTRHEFSIPVGIQEPVHEIVQNLRGVVFTGNISGIHNGVICVRGPGYITAQDILLSPPLEVVNSSRHIATLTEPVDVVIELQIERSCGYRMRTQRPKNEKEGSYPVDAAFVPVPNVVYSIHPFSDGRREMLFLEIITDGSLSAKEAFYGALRKLADFITPFFGHDGPVLIEDLTLDPKENPNGVPGESSSVGSDLLFFPCPSGTKLDNKTALKYIFLDQLQISRSLYMELKQEKIYSVWDVLMNMIGRDFRRRQINFSRSDRIIIINFLREYFPGEKFIID